MFFFFSILIVHIVWNSNFLFTCYFKMVKMSETIICQRFIQNAWKKDLCSNCFKSKEDHVVLPEKKINYKWTSHVNNFPQQVNLYFNFNFVLVLCNCFANERLFHFTRSILL